MGKTVDESMSAIQFCTTPKVDLQHYSYMSSKTKPSEKDMKNVACSSLGTMLHLEIQMGKEAINTCNFQNNWRYCSVNEETNYEYKRVWLTGVK